jgi:hypothetical protein
MTHLVPREHQRSKALLSVPKQVLATLLPNATAHMTLFVHRVPTRINEDRAQTRIVVGLAMEQEQARLRGDRHPNLVVEIEPSTPLEVLLREEDLDMAKQLGLVRRRQPSKHGQIALDDRTPVWRDGQGAKLGPTSRGKEAEDHAGIYGPVLSSVQSYDRTVQSFRT